MSKAFGTMPYNYTFGSYRLGEENNPNYVRFRLGHRLNLHFIAILFPFVSMRHVYPKEQAQAICIDGKNGKPAELSFTINRGKQTLIDPEHRRSEFLKVIVVEGSCNNIDAHEVLKRDIDQVKNQLTERLGTRMSIEFPEGRLNGRCPIIRSGKNGQRLLAIVGQ